ncbi:unnamed protein product, partial [Durusdinium trenchii]
TWHHWNQDEQDSCCWNKCQRSERNSESSGNCRPADAICCGLCLQKAQNVVNGIRKKFLCGRTGVCLGTPSRKWCLALRIRTEISGSSERPLRSDSSTRRRSGTMVREADDEASTIGTGTVDDIRQIGQGQISTSRTFGDCEGRAKRSQREWWRFDHCGRAWMQKVYRTFRMQQVCDHFRNVSCRVDDGIGRPWKGNCLGNIAKKTLESDLESQWSKGALESSCGHGDRIPKWVQIQGENGTRSDCGGVAGRCCGASAASLFFPACRARISREDEACGRDWRSEELPEGGAEGAPGGI